jgi:copper chaperone NosL
MKSATLVLATLLVGIVGCGDASDPWPPPAAEVHLGEDACAHCRMLVSDGRFAAQARRRAAPDEVMVFDDFGCLVAESAKAPIDPQGVFVRDFNGEVWVRGDVAFIVRSGDIASPMGSGYAAFATRLAAEKEAACHSDAAVSQFAGFAGPVIR